MKVDFMCFDTNCANNVFQLLRPFNILYKLQSHLSVEKPKVALQMSRSAPKKLTRLKFMWERQPGSPFGLHTEDWGLYSLNYSHAGASKWWVIILLPKP